MENTPNLIYLGPPGSYTEVAAECLMKKCNIDKFNRNIKNSIIGVIEAMDDSVSQKNKIGVVPVENSIEGIVRETIDNLIRTKSNVIITSEMIVPVTHCLISKTKNPENIDRIISISQALAQCRSFLEKKFPEAEKITAKSTSGAVKQLNELPENYAAIGSARAAEIYGYNIIYSGINDEKDNITRFVSLGYSVPEPSGRDKTSIAFSTNNRPGALVEILQVFRENNINLSYLESRPSRKVFGDYTFFMDFDGHLNNENVYNTLEKTRSFVNCYWFLGSYPKGIAC